MEDGRVRMARRAAILANHFAQITTETRSRSHALEGVPCLQYEPPQANSGNAAFDVVAMRGLMDGHDIELRDKIYDLMRGSNLFQLKTVGDTAYLQADYSESLLDQRDKTMERILFFRDQGLLKGVLTIDTPEQRLRTAAILECMNLYDHGLQVKTVLHIYLWGGSILFLGTKRHHDKWLQASEDYEVRCCFAMTELGHGSNVRGIETVTSYDSTTQEFIINTPCESAQKYWIGGAAQHASYAVVFTQLHIGGTNEGVHAIICRIREPNGEPSPGVKIADCGFKSGLNGVDNGRLWFDNVRVPRENLLNAVADVSPEGHYHSDIKDPIQRFGQFLAPLTTGRLTIAVSAVYQSKVVLATAIRYALSRRAFSLVEGQPEELLLDYPSHQQRLLTLLAKTYCMSFAANKLKQLYGVKTAENAKFIHVLSSGLKAMHSWHFMRTAQECREACGGQGLKSDNKIGQMKSEYDVLSTFDGDNNILMQQVSKLLLADYMSAVKKRRPFDSLGLQHINGPRFIVPAKLESCTLRNPAFQIALLQLRERELIERLAEEVRDKIASGTSPVDAANQSYQLRGRLGEAFCEKQILEAHIEAEETQSGSIKEVLALTRSLFVLTVIDESPSFLRYGLLTSSQSLVIHREVAVLCTEVRPHALALVDSFGIPLGFLGPIAADWVEYNSWKNVRT